jgi:hypothetical protein
MEKATARGRCFGPSYFELFGKRGWQIGCARFLKRPDGGHVNVRTVRRWSSGKTPVPFWVELLLRAELVR